MANDRFKLSSEDIFFITILLLFMIMWLYTGDNYDKTALRRLVKYRGGRFY